MPKCVYCGKWAGLFTSYHEDCIMRYKSSSQEDPTVSNTEQPHKEKSRKEIVKDFEQKLASFLEDGLLTKEEEDELETMISQYDIKYRDTWDVEKMVKAIILRKVVDREKEFPIDFKDNCPVILEKDEFLIYAFTSIGMYQEKIKRTYVGSSAGFSVKIAKGLYYRTSGFKGNPIETSYMAEIDRGHLIVTYKNIYWDGIRKSMKIPLNKIMSVKNFDNGIAITKSVASAKPMIFKTDDGWFSYNLIMNLVNN